MGSGAELRRFVIGASLFAGFCASMRTADASLVLYDFSAVGGSNTTVPQPATSSDPGITASTFAPILNGAASSSTNSNSGMGFSATGHNAYLGTDALSTTVPGNDYWSFSVTPNGASSVTYSTLTFDALVGTMTAGTVSWDVRSSVDNYASSLGTVTGSGSSTGNSIDLSTLGTRGGEVDFHIYNYKSSNATFSTVTQIRVDNVAVNGTVVPEPAGLGILGIASVAVLRRRRAKPMSGCGC